MSRSDKLWIIVVIAYAFVEGMLYMGTGDAYYAFWTVYCVSVIHTNLRRARERRAAQVRAIMRGEVHDAL